MSWGDNNVERKEDRLYGCARFGCHKVNMPYLSYGALGKSWCLDHQPRWWERLLLRKHRPNPFLSRGKVG